MDECRIDDKANDRVKKQVTENKQRISRKFFMPRVGPNYVSLFGFTTPSSVAKLRVEEGERRNWVFETKDDYSGPSTAQSRDYFQTLLDVPWKAVYCFMARENLDGFDERQFPATLASREQLALGMSATAKWWQNCLSNGYIVGPIAMSGKSELQTARTTVVIPWHPAEDPDPAPALALAPAAGAAAPVAAAGAAAPAPAPGPAAVAPAAGAGSVAGAVAGGGAAAAAVAGASAAAAGAGAAAAAAGDADPPLEVVKDWLVSACYTSHVSQSARTTFWTEMTRLLRPKNADAPLYKDLRTLHARLKVKMVQLPGLNKCRELWREKYGASWTFQSL